MVLLQIRAVTAFRTVLKMHYKRHIIVDTQSL